LFVTTLALLPIVDVTAYIASDIEIIFPICLYTRFGKGHNIHV